MIVFKKAGTAENAGSITRMWRAATGETKTVVKSPGAMPRKVISRTAPTQAKDPRLCHATAETRRADSEERQAERGKRTPQEQLAIIAKRPGASSREVARLTALVARAEK